MDLMARRTGTADSLVVRGGKTSRHNRKSFILVLALGPIMTLGGEFRRSDSVLLAEEPHYNKSLSVNVYFTIQPLHRPRRTPCHRLLSQKVSLPLLRVFMSLLIVPS